MSGDEKVAPRINLCLLKPVARPSPRRAYDAPTNPNLDAPAAGSIKFCQTLDVEVRCSVEVKKLLKNPDVNKQMLDEFLVCCEECVGLCP